MDSFVADILAFTLPTVILLAAWIILHKRPYARFAFTGVLVGVLSACALLGALLWQQQHEGTQLASATTFTSTVWFSGPLLIWTVGKTWHMAWSILAALLLPFASFMTCFFLLAITGQIWGM
jgi:hypothetical protein